MVVIPVVTPVTMPVLPTVAMAGLALLQVPPGVALLNVVVAPMHSLVMPVIAATDGEATTVSGVNITAVQPNAPVNR